MITETPRLRIRELTIGDAEFILGLVKEPSFLERIVGLTSEENLASIKALEKLGMSFEKMVKMSEDDPGTALYS